ncbi:MAG: nucleotidyltransferase family protein [Pyrinomonadaceae bacterium]
MISETATITDEFRWNLLQKRTQEINAVRAVTLFRENAIEPILIKGISAGRYYPADRPRISIDVDLAVASGQFDAALAVARSKEANGLAIDLHNELRHLDTLAWDDLFDRSELTAVDKGEIRMLCAEDALRVLCLHWLTDGGANRERLWDIFYAVANRDADFDWDRLLNVVSPTRRRWIVCTLGLAAKYLGLDLTESPVAADALDLPKWLIETVEQEWASKTKFEPLEVAITDRKRLLKQLGRRLRPNPIWATIQAEGSFDAKTRVFYQIANIFRRTAPSFRRVTATIAARSSND